MYVQKKHLKNIKNSSYRTLSLADCPFVCSEFEVSFETGIWVLELNRGDGCTTL